MPAPAAIMRTNRNQATRIWIPTGPPSGIGLDYNNTPPPPRIPCGALSCNGRHRGFRRDRANEFSERRHGFPQEGELCFCRFPAQGLVTMRKAAEPPDDLGMAVDEGHELRRLVTLPGTMGLDPGLEQGDAALLVRQGFAVLERHIEEEA